MPRGRGYDASQKAVDRLAANVTFAGGRIHEDFDRIGQTFCSGATYIVFLKTLELLQTHAGLGLSPQDLAYFATLHAKDGEHVFGRWNANGPGTAKLFTELQCGSNFTSYEKALPGDFMKIWWTDEIGGKERGHSVVYLGASGDQIHYWSSNIPHGYGNVSVSKSKIKRVLFSRLDHIANLKTVRKLPSKNIFLADMLVKSFSWDQVANECRVTEVVGGR